MAKTQVKRNGEIRSIKWPKTKKIKKKKHISTPVNIASPQ